MQVAEERVCLSFHWVLPTSLQQKWSVCSRSLTEERWSATSPLSSPPGSCPVKAGHPRVPHSASLMPYWCWIVLCLNSPSSPRHTRRREQKGWLALVNTASLRFLAPEWVWGFSHPLGLADTVHANSLQWCLTLCNPMDRNPMQSHGRSMGFSFVHGILQVRTLGCHALLQGVFPTQG